MARSPFSLYKRPCKKTPSRYSYYVQFWNPELQAYNPGRSVKRLMEAMNLDPTLYSPRQKSCAADIARLWMEQAPKQREKTKIIMACDYFMEFWDWKSSNYIKIKLARHPGSIGQPYCKTNQSWVRRYVQPHFQGMALTDVKPAHIEALMLKLKEETSLNTRTINYVLQAIRVPLNEAARLGLLKENPSSTIQRYGTSTFERGILSSDEVQKLFSLTWEDLRAYTAFQVAVTGGLRLGEILALQPTAIARDHIIVAHSYSKTVGLKSTKTNKSRVVPLPPDTIDALNKLIKNNPWENHWIFYSTRSANNPMTDKLIEELFYVALARIGIVDDKSPAPDPKSRQGRRISFHSLRHYCNAMLRGVLGDEKLRMLTGHSDIKMTNHYDHITDRDLALIRKAQEETILNQR